MGTWNSTMAAANYPTSISAGQGYAAQRKLKSFRWGEGGSARNRGQ
jgi:hypothetical protein